MPAVAEVEPEIRSDSEVKPEKKPQHPNSRANLKVGSEPKPPPVMKPRTDNEPGISKQLAAYRWVDEQDKAFDDTDRKKRARAFRDETPIKFDDKLEALEREWAASKAAKSGSAAAESEAPFPEMEEAWDTFREWANARSS